jgi:uncharacterized repeat protein (TIGR01451 family)
MLSFAVDVASSGWVAGDLISNTVAFDSGTGQAFERTVTTVLSFPDPSPSTKFVEQAVALAGDPLTYTVRIESDSMEPARFVLSDPIPAGTSYLRGPECTSGTCAYDPARRAINWQGMLPILAGPDAVGGGYAWGDSDGNGSVPAVKFEWTDITGTGTNAGVGDDMYYCDLPIGFPFKFFGSVETDFCASTNGFVSFDRYGFSDLTNECPLPNPADFGALIAALWDDLVVENGVYYQTFGAAPNRVLVVQWAGVRHYGDEAYFDFELILYERGSIECRY